MSKLKILFVGREDVPIGFDNDVSHIIESSKYEVVATIDVWERGADFFFYTNSTVCCQGLINNLSEFNSRLWSYPSCVVGGVYVVYAGAKNGKNVVKCLANNSDEYEVFHWNKLNEKQKSKIKNRPRKIISRLLLAGIFLFLVGLFFELIKF